MVYFSDYITFTYYNICPQMDKKKSKKLMAIEKLQKIVKIRPLTYFICDKFAPVHKYLMLYL